MLNVYIVVYNVDVTEVILYMFRLMGIQESEVFIMSSLDKTMKFNFQDDPFEGDVQEVLMQVYDALRKKDIIRLIKSLAIFFLEILPIFLDIKMHVHHS